MMIPDFTIVFLNFLETYLVIDSVIPDMDNPEEVIPRNLKWTVPVEQQLLREFFSLMDSPKWSPLTRDKSRNITVESLFSPAYMRRLIRATTYFEAKVKTVVDTVWMQFWLANITLHSSAEHPKLLDYGGKDRFAVQQRSSLLEGFAAAPRVFDVFVLRRDCVVKADDSRSFVSTGKNYCADGTPNLVLYTNTSGNVPYAVEEGAVRASYGTSGMLMTAVGKFPPMTKMSWIFNADFILPPMVPDPFGTRLVAGKLRKSIIELKNYIERDL